MSSVRLLARQDQLARVTGIKLQGANSIGSNCYESSYWSGKNITSSAVSVAAGVWQDLTVTNPDASYRYIRFANDTQNWYGNAGELELYGEVINAVIPSHNITYNATAGGIISVVTSAREGEAVSVTVKPEADYRQTANSLVYYKNSDMQTAYPITNGQFTMPTEDITITANFEKIPADANGVIRLNRSQFIASANSAFSGNPASNAIDGDTNTYWHSDWTSGTSNFNKDTAPYELTINMGKAVPISRYIYKRRIYTAGTPSTLNGIITQYEIKISQNNTAWTTVAQGYWNFDSSNPDADERTATFNTVTAKYVKLTVRDNAHQTPGTYAASAAEVNIEELNDATPVNDAKAALNEKMDLINAMPDSAVKTYLVTTAANYLNNAYVTVEAVNELLSIYNYYTQSMDWINRGINPVYLTRLNNNLSDSSFSGAAKKKYFLDMKGFNALGTQLDGGIIKDMGPEFLIPSGEETKCLADRMESAINRAKARIDAHLTENYIMLKELISYITAGDNPKYTDMPNAFGTDAATCEYVVTTINFTLSNLEKIDAGVLDPAMTQYKSGEVWLDQYGSKIQAGGGKVIQVGNTYYWYGEDNKIAYPLHTGVSCYSSQDLKTWKYEGLAFNAFDQNRNRDFTSEFLTDNISGTQGRIERPKVIYNERTGKYVMWMHLEKDGVYTFSEAGVAVSDSPTGPFTWQWYGLPVCDPYVTYNQKIVQAVRDMNVFVDDDGTAYVIYASEANQTPYIVRLNSDYTWIDTTGLNTAADPLNIVYDSNGMYSTGTLYNYNATGTGYVDASGNAYVPTAEDLKTVIYFDTRSPGPNAMNTTTSKYNYHLPSLTRYQLACGEGITTVNGTLQRADGLTKIPTRQDGRWAKIGQYTGSFTTALEAPAPIKIGGVYYLVCSGISGWQANPGKSLKTNNLLGQWTYCGNPFTGSGPQVINPEWTAGWDASASKSFNSQSTSIFKANGKYYYMGDRWKNADYSDGGVKKSTYVWLPITMEASSTTGDSPNLKIYWQDAWPFYDYYIVSAVANTVMVSALTDNYAVLYAAKYADGRLTNVFSAPVAKGTSTINVGFTPDKVFLWDRNMIPLDKKYLNH